MIHYITYNQWNTIWYCLFEPSQWITEPLDGEYKCKMSRYILWDETYPNITYMETYNTSCNDHVAIINGDEKYINILLLQL